ncbi:STAS domain-containing protein [Streptomyces sp. NPDC007369]|uniref:STAS domain-containing protein n=1 Tax=Streptomyces sp. NPDC007369 TaxID=3154589 RepID=UPI0034055710
MSSKHERSVSSDGAPAGRPGTATCRAAADGMYVITLVGDFDADPAKELTRAFEHAARTGTRTVVDCTGITFADVFLLHALIDAVATHDLVLAGPLPHPLTALLDGTETTGNFTIAETLDAALHA